MTFDDMWEEIRAKTPEFVDEIDRLVKQLSECVYKDQAVRAFCESCWARPVCTHKTYCKGLMKVLELPAADVAPVVRCKNCRYWNRTRISCEGLTRCLTGESGVRYRKADDFCSRGVRKEQNDDATTD